MLKSLILEINNTSTITTINKRLKDRNEIHEDVHVYCQIAEKKRLEKRYNHVNKQCK